MKYFAYTLNNFRDIPQISALSEEQKFVIEVVGTVLPFKTSNYVVDRLIDWDNFENDPFFILNFPQKKMLSEKHFNTIANLIRNKADRPAIRKTADHIRMELNPNPAGQEYNVPELDGIRLQGIQHKYKKTMLVFPAQGQTCHAYCTFCFRWPQFALNDFKFSMKSSDTMVQYIEAHPEISDILFTGGDPAVMRTKHFNHYFNAILNSKSSHIRFIRIGTKALTYWPHRFTTDSDAGELLELFKKVTDRGIGISVMAHFNHPKALRTEEVREAIARLREAGVQIRSQSPIMKHINDKPAIWADMWREQVNLGITPYYMFIARDTGAQDYFAVTLERAWKIYTEAYKNVSGLCRTVRGPSMSCGPGKVHVVGITKIQDEKVFVLKFIQSRDEQWVNQPFFAKYNPNAIWITDLEPAFGKDRFMFENDSDLKRNSA
ncbi:MAG: lysine 2,3-aminomutase [Prolixibacteraceae bacterium]|jgi:KamA family protein|nr:lysine 2,3-aminomutase [Prolixibacteraceae bacterium]